MRRLLGTPVYWAYVALTLAAFTISVWAESNERATEAGKRSLMTIAPGLTPVSDYTGDLRNRSTFFGDPAGNRQRLYDKGIAFDLSVTQVYQGVTSGGEDSEWKYSGAVDYSLALDTRRMGLWPAGLLTVHGKTKFGRSVNSAARTLSSVNYDYLTPDPAEKSESFLEEYYVVQMLTGKLSLLAGRVLWGNFGDINRFAYDARTQFLNGAFKTSPLLGVLTTARSLHGIALPCQATPNLIVAPFILSSNDKDNVWGSPGGLFSEYSTGVRVIVSWRLGDLPGEARPIFGYNTKDVTALDDPDLESNLLSGITPAKKHGNWVVGFTADQYFYMPEKGRSPTVRTATFDRTPEGIGVFVRFHYAPEDRNPWNVFVSGGIGGRGVIPSRPLDRYGLGVYGLIESEKLEQHPQLGATFGTEVGWEAFYNVAITPWLQITPDIQYIHPGRNGGSHAAVVGMRLHTSF